MEKKTKLNQDKKNTLGAKDNFGVSVLSFHHFTGSGEGSRFPGLTQQSLNCRASHLELLIASHKLSSREASAGLRQELEQRPWRSAASWLASLPCSPAFLYSSGLLAQGCHHRRGLCPPNQSANKKIRTVSERDISTKILLFPDISRFMSS